MSTQAVRAAHTARLGPEPGGGDPALRALSSRWHPFLFGLQAQLTGRLLPERRAEERGNLFVPQKGSAARTFSESSRRLERLLTP